MSSGVKVNAECDCSFQKVKNRKLGYCIFKITENFTEIKIEQEGDFAKDDGGERIETMLELFPKDEPRYAVMDFKFTGKEGYKKDAVVFVFWSPETSGTKPKMVYASSKNSFLKGLTGVKVIDVNERSDLSYAALIDKCS